ncbi:hypothetical protein EKO04_003472 [Ascochyta lentis]|uniref:Uncharacterized protein n=1 Tax=Ascochyta lentis TaxID=205686 RepID=A0A8H7MK66_9PLEO|nr:hypothetical protein EKO04_003472 [Ascochyta lentis]
MRPERIVSLSAVREVLDKAQSEHTSLFVSLMGNGRNHPYACKPPQRLVFGPNESDFPGLGKKLSPFDINTLPSPDNLQKLLIDDLQTARKEHNDHISHAVDKNAAADSEAKGENADLKLLESLTGHDSETREGLVSFPSPSLDGICDDAKVEDDNTLQESMTAATILYRNTLLSLQHSNEGTTFTTLLSGAVAWIIWPPTVHNLNILRTSYEAFANGLDDAKINVATELKGGVCLVQSVGEAIRIPPFSLMLCLSLEMSILATYSVVTAGQVVGMLRQLPLLQAWFKTEVDGERKRVDLFAALLENLSFILEGKFESTNTKTHKYPYLQEGPLRSLLQTWDGVKDNVACVLNPGESEHLVEIWGQFLRSARGRECWICGRNIHNKLRDMRKHFETEHWPAKNVVEVTEDLEMVVTPTIMQEETGKERSFHDAMEVIGSHEGIP